MDHEILEFTTSGAPRIVSQTIEQYATSQGRFSAIVVPWESDQTVLNMAVTSSRIDGWAIEHTNLGTIRLTDLGNNLTRVSILARDADHAEKKKLTALFEGFARQIQNKFQPAS